MVRRPVEDVWAWWTDYGAVGSEERITHGLGIPSRRRVVSREGEIVVLRESVLGISTLEHRIELHPAQRAFREEAKAFTAWWRFERSPEGTRVRREVETRGWAPRGPAVWAARRDLEHHARQCEAYLS